MFCNNCGKEISDMAEICPNCGVKVKTKINSTDVPNLGVKVASCCFPIVGLILYFIWKDEKPNSSKAVCHWAIGGLILGVLLYIIAAMVGVLASL